MKNPYHYPSIALLLLSLAVALFAETRVIKQEPIAGHFDLFRVSTNRLFAIEAYEGDGCFNYQASWVLAQQDYFNHLSPDGTRRLQKIVVDKTNHYVIWDMVERKLHWRAPAQGDTVRLPNGSQVLLGNCEGSDYFFTFTDDLKRALQDVVVNGETIVLLWNLESKTVMKVLPRKGETIALPNGSKVEITGTTVMNYFHGPGEVKQSFDWKGMYWGQSYAILWDLYKGKIKCIVPEKTLPPSVPEYYPILKPGDTVDAPDGSKAIVESAQRVSHGHTAQTQWVCLLLQWKRHGHSKIINAIGEALTRMNATRYAPKPGLSSKPRLVILNVSKRKITRIMPNAGDTILLPDNTKAVLDTPEIMKWKMEPKQRRSSEPTRPQEEWLDLSPDGKLGVQALRWNGKLHSVLWDLEKGKCLKILVSNDDSVQFSNGTIAVVKGQSMLPVINAYGASISFELRLNDSLYRVDFHPGMVNAREIEALGTIAQKEALARKQKIESVRQSMYLAQQRKSCEYRLKQIEISLKNTPIFSFHREPVMTNFGALVSPVTAGGKIMLPDGSYLWARSRGDFLIDPQATRGVEEMGWNNKMNLFVWDFEKGNITGVIPGRGEELTLPDGTKGKIVNTSDLRPSEDMTRALWTLYFSNGKEYDAVWDLIHAKLIKVMPGIGDVVVLPDNSHVTIDSSHGTSLCKNGALAVQSLTWHAARHSVVWDFLRNRIDRILPKAEETIRLPPNSFSSGIESVPILARYISHVNMQCTRAIESVQWKENRYRSVIRDLTSGTIIKILPEYGDMLLLLKGKKVQVEADRWAYATHPSLDEKWVIQYAGWEDNLHVILWDYATGRLHRVLPCAKDAIALPDGSKEVPGVCSHYGRQLVNGRFTTLRTKSHCILWDFEKEKTVDFFPRSPNKIRLADGSELDLGERCAQTTFIHESGDWLIQSVSVSEGVQYKLRWDLGPLDRRSLEAQKQSLEEKIAQQTTEIKKIEKSIELLGAQNLPIKKEVVRIKKGIVLLP
jgi:signal peptidase I